MRGMRLVIPARRLPAADRITRISNILVFQSITARAEPVPAHGPDGFRLAERRTPAGLSQGKGMLKSSCAAAAALLLAGCVSPAANTSVAPSPVSGDGIATSGGDLVIHPINHASMVLSWAGRTIYVDPVGGPEPYRALPRPDLILLTDIHPDHLNADTLIALVHAGTVIVASQAARDQLPARLQASTRILANGGEVTMGDTRIEAIAAYNLTPERLQFHPKGRGNGYVINRGGKRVYIAGDTEDVPEMRALRDIDVAFVPMNLPYTMTVAQAADGVRAFRPKAVYPYHSRGSDVAEFARRVGIDAGVEVRIRDWY